MGLPIGNTRAKIYSTSVIEIFFFCFLLIATFIYQASPTKKKHKKNNNKKTTKKNPGKLSNDKNRRSFNKHHILRMRCTVVSNL